MPISEPHCYLWECDVCGHRMVEVPYGGEDNDNLYFDAEGEKSGMTWYMGKGNLCMCSRECYEEHQYKVKHWGLTPNDV